jgi:SAM-dependent methyltransferase
MPTTRPCLATLCLAFALACGSTRARPDPVRPSNRDPHGGPDVHAYIDRLQSPDRLEDLQVDRVIQTIAPAPDATIGDLGCGPGIFVLGFANACVRGVVYASDIEPAQLDRVREHIAATGLRNIVPVLASPDDPHFPPGRLDVVFVSDTYHHLENRVEYMRELRSVFRPGGRLVLLEYKPGPLPVGPPPAEKLAHGELERELVEAGYVRVERYETHPYHDFEVWRVVQTWEQARK